MFSPLLQTSAISLSPTQAGFLKSRGGARHARNPAHPPPIDALGGHLSPKIMHIIIITMDTNGDYEKSWVRLNPAPVSHLIKKKKQTQNPNFV